MTRKKQKEEFVTIDNEGRIIPNNAELEAVILGAILIEERAMSQISSILRPSHFYNPQNKMVYEACLEMFNEAVPIDLMTVVQRLRKNGTLEVVGGVTFISQLTNRVASSRNIETYARIIIQDYIRREIIHTTSKLAIEAYDTTIDIFDLHTNAITKLMQVLEENIKPTYQKSFDLVNEAMQMISDRMNGESKQYVPSQIRNVSNKIGGFYQTESIVIGARPGMGKTAYVLSEAYGMGRNGIPVGIFSLEMGKMQLMHRLISMASLVDLEMVSKGKPTNEEFERISKAQGIVESLPIYIDDTPDLNVFDFRAKAKKMVENEGIRIIIIDYLQLMSVGDPSKNRNENNRQQEISIISRTIKLVAKELDVPVIALSQLSRDCESRPDKRPVLKDLRESGSIEQDADVVAFLYRDEYYNPDGDNKGKGELIIAKNRSGKPNQTALMNFKEKLAQYTAFADLNEVEKELDF